MVKALLPTPPAEKAKWSLQLVWLDQMFMAIGLKIHPKIKRSIEAQQSNRVPKLPPTTTSLYSVMAYKGRTSRDFPFYARQICCFLDETAGFSCTKSCGRRHNPRMVSESQEGLYSGTKFINQSA